MDSSKIRGRRGLKTYYQREEVVSGYLRERFGNPLGRLQNHNQIRSLNKLIARYKPKRVLELACGPARVTPYIEAKVVGLDSSLEMLVRAKGRFGGKGDLVGGDVFNLPFKECSFPFVFALRFIRHFDLKEREKIFSEIGRVLLPGGLLIFDVPNYEVEYPVRLKRGLDHYPIYDKLWGKEEFLREMAQNGLQVLEMRGNIYHYRLQAILSRLNLGPISFALIRIGEFFKWGQPLEWSAICQKG